MGIGAQMRNGEIQMMPAGSGVMPSVSNASPDEGLHHQQMGMQPNKHWPVFRV